MSLRVVFDCMIFLQSAARATGPAAACLQLVKDGYVQLFLSPEVVAEVRDVLNRSKTRQKFSTLNTEVIETFIQDLAEKAALLTDAPKVMSLDRDPKDEPYLNLAVAAGARYLVTRDKDLLDLMKEEIPEGKEFRKRFPELTILDPVAFLQQISQKPKDPKNSE